MILQNKRGIKGKTTTPVVVVGSFLNAVFNIEKKYASKATYTIIHKGKPRQHLLYHVTNADIQAITILLKICNLQGLIHDTNSHKIYRVLQQYYEDPISISQFYASMKKLYLHKIISVSHNPYSNQYDYKLNHYMNPSTGRVGYYVALTPIVFIKEFTHLSIAVKKLFYSVYVQQGEKKDPQQDVIERRLLTDKSDVQFSGLYHFLHRKDAYHIKKILHELVNTPVYKGACLFYKAELVKRGRDYHKAILFVNPELFPSERQKYSLHDTIPPTIKHKRKASFIKQVLTSSGMNEIMTLSHGKIFNGIVNVFKQSGYRIIRYALYQLKLYHHENSRFPEDICFFLAQEKRNKTLAIIMDIARKTKIYPYISPAIQGNLRKEREYEFASKMSQYSRKLIEQACRYALPKLVQFYSLPVVHNLSMEQYAIKAGLDEVKGIDVVRFTAFKKKRNLREYMELEEHALERYQAEKHMRSFNTTDFLTWMLNQVESMESVEVLPNLVEGFKLEDYLIREILPLLE